MKIKIQIKHWVTGSVLFEYETENNTIAKTVNEAIKQNADLRSADLRSANLSYADLSSAKEADYAIALTRILPEGSIMGYKRCQDGKIAKLLIPAEAKRSHAFGRKCRAEYAEVLEITKGCRKLKTAVSNHDSNFKYEVGKTVKPTRPFSDNWLEECESGIHFFITKIEAINYV